MEKIIFEYMNIPRHRLWQNCRIRLEFAVVLHPWAYIGAYKQSCATVLSTFFGTGSANRIASVSSS